MGGMSTATVVLALVAGAGAAANAGVFYTFSSFVMPALARMPSARGAAAMQSINITAVRPPFMLLFMGTALLSVAAIVVGIASFGEEHGPWLIAGGVLYLVGSLGLTMAYSVPRNDALARLDPGAPATEATWRTYLREWTAANHVRAAASLLAAAALAIATQA
jgi:uncharacterized membrane protein